VRKLYNLQEPHRVIGIAITVGVFYFLAARLGLALLTKPEGVAVFWPASGIAVGALIVLGRRARVPVAAGVMLATVVANLMGDRNMLSASAFALCNTGEMLLTTWLIERWFGAGFRFDDLRHVIGLLVAAVIGTATAAIVATVAIRHFHSAAPALDIWQAWFTSDAIGIVGVAPLLITFASAMRTPPPRREFIEGVLLLIALAVISKLLFVLPPGIWATVLPEALLFPLLLLLAARCHQVFSAAAAFMVALAIVWATTFGIGFLGDPNLPIGDRIIAAQISILAAVLCALALTALFTERRQNEATLEASRKQLQLVLNGAELGAFVADVATGRLEGDVRAAHIHGHRVPPMVVKDWRRFVLADDLASMDAAFTQAERSGGVCKAEYRVLYPPDHPHAGEVHWIALEGSFVRSAHGRPAQFFGATRDITQRKEADEELRLSRARLAGIVDNANDAIISVDQHQRITLFNNGAGEIFGYTGAEVIGQPFDILLPARLRDAHRQHLRSYAEATVIARKMGERREIVGRRKDGTEFPAEATISKLDMASGTIFTAILRDISERKRAEERQNLLIAELDHRVKNVLARIAVVARYSREGSPSMDDLISALDNRIQSMADAHALLSRSRWQGVSLTDLVRHQLAPYATADNTTVGGPDVALTAEATEAVAMVLHELVTNAAKYGALATPHGHVSVSWHQPTCASSSARLVCEWQETGGPPVVVPSEFGFGASVIRDLIPYELGGAVDLDFAAAGLRCRIEIPLKWMSSDRPTVYRS
jgi:PAS domain S-box-containing protein